MVTRLWSDVGNSLQACEIDMALTMRFVEHLNTTLTNRVRAMFLHKGKVSLISVFRMVDSDSAMGRLVDFVPVDFRNMWVVFGL